MRAAAWNRTGTQLLYRTSLLTICISGLIQKTRCYMAFYSGRSAKLRKGFVAGLCGGLAGTIAMTQFQNGWSKAAQALEPRQDFKNNSSGQSEQSGNATMKVADSLAHLAGRRLSFSEKRKAGLLVHYAFGTTMGALYGITAEMSPRAVRRHAALSGFAFGSSLFIVADEVAVTRLGLSSGPAPLSSHLYALASHLLYGLTTGLVYAELRKQF